MTSIDLIADPSVAPDAELEHWLAVAAEAAKVLRADVVERDRANVEPAEEIGRLRDAGLLTVTIPADVGGHGAPWGVGLQIARVLARVDGSIAQLLAYHYGWLRIVASFRSPSATQILRQTVDRQWFWGSAGNGRPHRRAGLPIYTPSGDGGGRVSGASGFATGASVSDRILVRATHADTGNLLIIATDPRNANVQFTGEWDVLGQRLSASRGIDLQDVAVAPEELLAEFGPIDQPATPIWSIAVLNFQLIFGVLHLGITEGALLEAAAYTREQARPFLHSLVEVGSEEPFVLQSYGAHVAHVQAVSALLERGERALAWAYAEGDSLTAGHRAQVAETIASAKVASTETGLAVASGLFDLTGARATATSFGLDRFWRDLRTLSLHDPVAYKKHELGQYFVNGHGPVPSGYR